MKNKLQSYYWHSLPINIIPNQPNFNHRQIELKCCISNNGGKTYKGLLTMIKSSIFFVSK